MFSVMYVCMRVCRSCCHPSEGLHDESGSAGVSRAGMDVVWKIDVENFPAFIVVDDKGNDFYSKWIPKTRRAGKDIISLDYVCMYVCMYGVRSVTSKSSLKGFVEVIVVEMVE
jgi:hypothetical protein